MNISADTDTIFVRLAMKTPILVIAQPAIRRARDTDRTERSFDLFEKSHGWIIEGHGSFMEACAVSENGGGMILMRLLRLW